MKEIVVGILGAGRIGKLHAENIMFNIPKVKLKTIVDIKMNNEMKSWAEGIGIVNTGTNSDEVFNDLEIDAVLICSSTDTHAEFIIKAARAGKHIFCEKPIAQELSDIYEALETVEKANVKLQMGFVRRFDHNHKRVRDMVMEGKVGDPQIVKISSRDPEPPSIEYVKTSGGLFFDMMIHDFDMARYLSGSEVVEVYTQAAVLIDPEVSIYNDVDTAIVTMEFENGAIGVIDNSRASNYGYDQRVEVHGSKGCVQDSNDLSTTMVTMTREGVFSDRPKWFFLERYNDAFIAEVKAFVEAIRNDTEPEVGGFDGLQPVLIAQAAKLSRELRRPVKISEIIDGM